MPYPMSFSRREVSRFKHHLFYHYGLQVHSLEGHRLPFVFAIVLVVALQRFNVPTLPFLHRLVAVGPPLLCALTRPANLGLELLVQWLATSILSNTTTGRLILGVIRGFSQFNALYCRIALQPLTQASFLY